MSKVYDVEALYIQQSGMYVRRCLPQKSFYNYILYTIKHTYLDKTVLLSARPLQHLMIVVHNIGLSRYHNIFEVLPKHYRM